jgi:flagellar assembly protein FliH
MRTSSLPNTLSDPAFQLTGGVPSELLESAQQQARAVGYAQGWTQGLREAAAGQAVLAEQVRIEQQAAAREQAERVGSAVQAVLRAAEQVQQTLVEVTDQLSDQMLAATVELAAVLLGQQLADPEVAAAAVLRRVLPEVPDGQPVTIRLSPTDYDTLTGPVGVELLTSLQAADRVSFESDPSLAVGDAIARSAATSIDARLTVALARLREYAG